MNEYTDNSTKKSYPDNNPKTVQGLAKAPLHLVPPALVEGAAEAFANGAEKYGPFNWREAQISSTVYYAACLRHLHAWYDRADPQDAAPDSEVHHLKHAVACLALLLDTMGTDLLNDNRPPARKKPCQAATTPNTSSDTRKPPSKSRSERPETRPATTWNVPVGYIKETDSTSITETPSQRAARTPLQTGEFGPDMPTGQKGI